MAESGHQVKQFARILGRIAIIALAVAFFAGLTTIYARTMRPPVNRGRGPGDRRGRQFNGDDRRGRDNRDFTKRRGPGDDRGEPGDLRRRPDQPQLVRFPDIFKEGALFALVTFAGRKILRLRL